MVGFEDRYFWVIAIIVTCMNGAWLWARSRRYVEAEPSLEAGYRVLIHGTLTWMNMPWAIMGVGALFGSTTSVMDYFRPQDGNVFVVAFFASAVAIWVLGTYWVFFGGGAELISTLPGVFRVFKEEVPSPLLVKLMWILCLAGGIGGVTMMLMNPHPSGPLR